MGPVMLHFPAHKSCSRRKVQLKVAMRPAGGIVGRRGYGSMWRQGQMIPGIGKTFDKVRVVNGTSSTAVNQI